MTTTSTTKAPPPPRGGGGGDGFRPKFAYLDLDIDNHRAKHALAREFVKHTDLRYHWTSKVLRELGGGEKTRVKEMFASDYEWSEKGNGEIELEPAAEERVVFELFWEKAPLACENFAHLCAGDKGTSKTFGGVPFHYKGCIVHRCVKSFMLQSGDFVHNNGTGGESIWGKKFKDELGGLKGKHDDMGVLSMGNTGKNSNGSQFFITLGPAKQCDGKHVIFGKCVKGETLLKRINEELARDSGETTELPKREIRIADCGVLE